MVAQVGVIGWYGGDITEELKRAAVIFERLGVRHVHSRAECEYVSDLDSGRATSETVDKLRQHNILIDPPDPENLKVRPEWVDDLPDVLQPNRQRRSLLRALREVVGDGAVVTDQEFDVGVRAAEVYARLAALQLETDGISAAPVVSGSDVLADLRAAQRADVMRIVVDTIPLPAPDTPWEAIFEWRQDSDARAKLARLRLWLEKVVSNAQTIRHVKDELESTLNDYEVYMQLQHAKFKRGRLETILVASAEVFDSLPLLKISPLVKAVFEAKKQDAALLEAELQAPGRELAFITAARAKLRRASSSA